MPVCRTRQRRRRAQTIKDAPTWPKAAIIGEVLATPEVRVSMLEQDGTVSTIEELYGAELPRLC